jgi:16S rRNA (cytosine967-C5)-methyltransferase
VIAPARRAALDVLRTVDAGRLDLPAAIARGRTSLSDERDRALLVELATGVFRWRAQIDHLIATSSSRPLHKLDPVVRDTLRLGVYQLLHLERVPDSAVVDDAVNLVRASGKTSAAGFVNAILRRIGRGRGSLPLPPRPAVVHEAVPDAITAAIDYLAVTLSHPRWLVERWLSRVGFDRAERWARFDNETPALTLRINTCRVTRDAVRVRLADHGVQTTPTRYAPDGLTVTGGNPLRTPLADEGLFVVQDEASQLVAEYAAVRPGERVLDACASPGGKTLALLAALNGRGLLVAADVRPRRVELLQRTLAVARADDVQLVRLDLMQPLPFGEAFDCVLVDAPCSGLGTIRRDPDIRWRRHPEDLPALADAQVRMLDHAARAVRPGGRLVYATCSSEPEENEGVVETFLAAHEAFAPGAAETVQPALAEPARPLVDEMGRLHTWPWRDGLEAFFAATLVRRG